MTSISLEAFDGELKGKLSQWNILPDTCSLPHGFQDQLLSSIPAFQTTILVLSKQESKAWLLSYSWDLTFVPESPTDWSLLLSILQHLKKPVLIVSTPKCQVPVAFWQKCLPVGQREQYTCTCAMLRDITESAAMAHHPHSIFFPKLDTISDTIFIKAAQQSIQGLDLRSIYRDLRGAGATLCLSLSDSRVSQVPSYSALWFYPENNGALRLHVSELRTILRTVTERLAD